MADFCQQCSVELFGEDFGDLAGLITAEQVAQGFGVKVLCEGCVHAFVDHNGRCHAQYCLQQHGAALPQGGPTNV